MHVNVAMAPRDAAVREINVIGAHAGEAVGASSVSSTTRWSRARTLRIIHGYGTGALRRAIAEFLRAHPFVANFGPRRPTTRAAAA